MTDFNPSDHPRDDDGRFGPKHHREADGVSLGPGRHFAFTSDDEDPDLDLGPESEPAGNEPEPLEFTPYEGPFPREKESVFGPDADEGEHILDGSPDKDGKGAPHEPWPFTPDEGPFPREKESVFGPDADEGEHILDGSPDKDGKGAPHEPWPFTPDEGPFPRKKDSVFAPGKPVTDLGPDTEDNEANRAYQAREAASRPARRGIFSRMFSALESFGTSVETRHRDEMDELESLARQNRIARAARRSEG